MGGDDRFLRRVQDIPEAVGGDVRHVDGHADAVHFRHDLASELRQAALAAFLVDAVGNVVAVAPGQGHAAHAQLVVHAQRFQAAVQGAAFLNGQERVEGVLQGVVHIVLREDLVDVDALVPDGLRFRQILVDELQGVARPAAPAEFLRRHVHGDELQAAAVGDDALRVEHQVVGPQMLVLLV